MLLRGQRITVKERKATLADGTLADSVLTMEEAFLNMLNWTDCCVEDLVYMTVVNLAKQLGFFSRKGSLEVGKDADIVILDETFRVYMAYCKGELVYQKGQEEDDSNDSRGEL